MAFISHEKNETIYESDDALTRAVICRCGSGLRVRCEHNPNSKSEYMYVTYGETSPLTHKMAVEIARRFVNGWKIPKRLEWR
jgi:hypothetical protein